MIDKPNCMIDCIPSRPKKKYPSTTVRYANRSQRYHLGDDAGGGGRVQPPREGGGVYRGQDRLQARPLPQPGDQQGRGEHVVSLHVASAPDLPRDGLQLGLQDPLVPTREVRDSGGRVVSQEVRRSDILHILHVNVSTVPQEKFNNLLIEVGCKGGGV